MPSVVQVSISTGGMPKLAVPCCQVQRDGLSGDWQHNRKYHGGPNRAVCLFSTELYGYLRTQGIDLPPGSVGENLTTTGLDLLSLLPGDRLQIGATCVIQVTGIREPCKKLNRIHPNLLKAIDGHSGHLARVLIEGTVYPGDKVAVVGPRTPQNEEPP